MALNSVNWLAVVVCVVVSMLSGSLWYNPKTFYPTWRKGIGMPETQAPGSSNMAVTWGLTIFSSFVQAVAMAFMVNAMGGLMGGASLVTGAFDSFHNRVQALVVAFEVWCKTTLIAHSSWHTLRANNFLQFMKDFSATAERVTKVFSANGHHHKLLDI